MGSIFFSRLKEEWRDLLAEAETFEELKRLIKKPLLTITRRDIIQA